MKAVSPFKSALRTPKHFIGQNSYESSPDSKREDIIISLPVKSGT